MLQRSAFVESICFIYASSNGILLCNQQTNQHQQPVAVMMTASGDAPERIRLGFSGGFELGPERVGGGEDAGVGFAEAVRGLKSTNCWSDEKARVARRAAHAIICSEVMQSDVSSGGRDESEKSVP